MSRATREKLRHHWYRTARAATAPPTGKDQGGKAPRVNTACRHAACAPHPFCIVEKLAEYRSVYVEGRDQYRIKVCVRGRGSRWLGRGVGSTGVPQYGGAQLGTGCQHSMWLCEELLHGCSTLLAKLLRSHPRSRSHVPATPLAFQALERAIQQVAGHGSPLEEDADVDHVGLGPKSAQKVRDVLRSGEFIRVAAVAGDKRLQVRGRVWVRVCVGGTGVEAARRRTPRSALEPVPQTSRHLPGMWRRRCSSLSHTTTPADPGALQRRVGRRPHHGPEMVCGWRPQPRGRGPAARPDGAAAGAPGMGVRGREWAGVVMDAAACSQGAAG